MGVHAHVVRDEQDRGADLALDAADHAEHVLLHDDIERGRRLVGDDEVGPADRGKRDGGALAHAAGQLVRIGRQHRGIELHPRQMGDDRAASNCSSGCRRCAARRNRRKLCREPPQRIEHVHRALHDVGEVPPADPRHLRRRRAVQPAVARQEREIDAAADDLQRRLDDAGDGLDQRGLAGARFAGEAVDLAAPDVEGDAVNRPDVAVDAEIAGAEMRLQVADRQDRPRRCRLRASVATAWPALIASPPPMRLSRLRGSMYSFIETASRNSPTKVMITTTVGKAIHHQMPATIAVCWLAQ